MTVLIIEDEIPAQERLKKQLLTIDDEVEIVACLDSVKKAIQWLNDNSHPDLLFLDIQLADGLSFSIFDSISTDKPIIFCTAYDEYAIQAFKLNSVDYLLKPIAQEDLESALDKFKKLHADKTPSIDMKALQQMLSSPTQNYKKRFMVKIGDKIKSVETKSISFFYSEQKATFFQTTEQKKYLIDYTLDQLQELIDPSTFFRLNRKYITSLEAISEVFAYSNSRLKVKLKNCDDQDILVSREKVAKLKDWLDA
ncbi:LytTR family DNA-binding domain-containing protein [Marivirga atlantica]|jgi:DNA-binding LytR/AlgR family response regulator|uniref:Response regulator transcription factor n=1 Tax=Marivirga atlantica TaxID=1548457 RepID=A0A937A574_9BACT|nr:LytTR family DNA-binding domain-containing protein [Marivirga atlantica]MBL0763837.1 response regulator transcription factor [Marivirga atlantica]